MLVATVFATALLWAVFGSQSAYAAPDPAEWRGESIIYDNHQFYEATEETTQTPPGIPDNAPYYVAIDGINDTPLSRKARVIYFAPGTSPPTATSATYITYDYSQTKEFTNPEGRTDIEITPQSESEGTTTCAVDGIGWIICPMTVFLAGAMDWVFNVVSGFVAVPPTVINDVNTPLYQVWNVMRSIANVAFIIAFLIIIYSQLTGYGVSNYGLKKLIPRLIIAAILVNVSFFITALAVDISNIAGYSLQNILISIREDTFIITNDTWSEDATNGWSTLTAFVLSGGAIAAGGYALSVATGGSAAAAVYLLVPLLIGLLLTVLFVLLVLAARQAIIVILIVVAPLAFVANLLPNTEKWFDKWKDLFISMMIFFPAFSLVFGGSQLAGGIIIQNADNLVMMIFGMAVQIAPLIITPLLIRLSGGLLGRIAGIINDPRRGAMDRAKNWSKERAGMHRAKSLQKPGGLNVFRRTAQRSDRNSRYVKRATQAYENAAEAQALERDQKRMGELYKVEKGAELRKATVDNTLKMRVQDDMNIRGSDLHLQNIRMEASGVKLNEASERTKAIVEEYKSGRQVATGELNNLMGDMTESLTRTAAETQRAESARFVQQSNIAKAFTNESLAAKALVATAAGVDPNGALRAQAKAESALSKLEQEALDSSVQLLNFKAVRAGSTLKKYALNVVSEHASGNLQDPQELEAALEAVAKDGQISALREARMKFRPEDQLMLTKLFARNAGTMKEKGGFDLQNDPSLANVSQAEMNASIAETIGDVTGENIKNVKAGFWSDVSKNIGSIISDTDGLVGTPRGNNGARGLEKAYLTITEALRHEDAGIQLGDRLQETIEIHKQLQAHFGDPSKEVDYDIHTIRRRTP